MLSLLLLFFSLLLYLLEIFISMTTLFFLIGLLGLPEYSPPLNNVTPLQYNIRTLQYHALIPCLYDFVLIFISRYTINPTGQCYYLLIQQLTEISVNNTRNMKKKRKNTKNVLYTCSVLPLPTFSHVCLVSRAHIATVFLWQVTSFESAMKILFMVVSKCLFCLIFWSTFSFILSLRILEVSFPYFLIFFYGKKPEVILSFVPRDITCPFFLSSPKVFSFF